MNFTLPPRLTTQNGEKRRVGFELEFGGLSIPEAADIIVRLFAGEIEAIQLYTARVRTQLGNFEIEADSTFLKEKKYAKYLEAAGLDSLSENMDEMFGKLAGTLIPFEIVTPPCPLINSMRSK